MKKNRSYYPILAGAVLAAGAILPLTMAEEKDGTSSKNSRKESSVTRVDSDEREKNDPVVQRIQHELIKPLNIMAKNSEAFSRDSPVSDLKYHLVELSDDSSSAGREFKIVMEKLYFASRGKKDEKSDYLKLRYLTQTGEILVKLKDEWVKTKEHPILKSLPKPKPKQRAVTNTAS